MCENQAETAWCMCKTAFLVQRAEIKDAKTLHSKPQLTVDFMKLKIRKAQH